MSIQSLRCVVLFFAFAPFASAETITYNVNVNTSSIAGTTGSLDLNFNPGPLVSQPASLQILNFASNGTLAGGPTLTGDVAGALAAMLTFDNGTGFNDYFEDFTFGSTISFEVSLFGSAVSSPDGTSTSGSTFAFSMFLDPAGTVPALTTDLTNGFAATIDVNLDGTTTVTNFSKDTGISPVPEPSSGTALIGTAIAIMGALLWFRRPRRARAAPIGET